MAAKKKTAKTTTKPAAIAAVPARKARKVSKRRPMKRRKLASVAQSAVALAFNIGREIGALEALASKRSRA